MRIGLNALAWQYEPGGVEALHVLETARLAAADPEVECVCLYQPRTWPVPEAPGLEVSRFDRMKIPLGAAVLEQWKLPQYARAQGVQILLSAFHRPSLFTRHPQAWLDSRFERRPAAPGSSRLSRAFDRAVAESGAACLGYSDLPTGSVRGIFRLAPWIDGGFQPERRAGDAATLRALGLTPGYILAHGLDLPGAARLPAAWSWVEAGVGASYPLVLLGSRVEAIKTVRAGAERTGLQNKIVPLHDLRLEQLPAIYRNAALFLQLDSVHSAQSLRWALACGLAVAGIEAAATSSVLGDAGYLAPAGDTRKLGAACLTLLVEEEMRRALSTKGLKRAGNYRPGVAGLVSQLTSIAAAGQDASGDVSGRVR